MTMDAVWNGAYGIDIDFQSNPDFPFLTRTIEIFKSLSNLNLLFKFLSKNLNMLHLQQQQKLK